MHIDSTYTTIKTLRCLLILSSLQLLFTCSWKAVIYATQCTAPGHQDSLIMKSFAQWHAITLAWANSLPIVKAMYCRPCTSLMSAYSETYNCFEKLRVYFCHSFLLLREEYFSSLFIAHIRYYTMKLPSFIVRVVSLHKFNQLSEVNIIQQLLKSRYWLLAPPPFFFFLVYIL